MNASSVDRIPAVKQRPGTAPVAISPSSSQKRARRIAMRRARFCELLGEIATGAVPGRCFTAGILSTLDAFMDAELGELLASLALSGEMHAALLAREGCMGVVLDTALAFETGSWERVPWSILAAHGIDQLAAERAYLDSLHWVSETLGAIDAGSVFS